MPPKKKKGISNKLNIVKNPNWQKADRWLFTKCHQVFELETAFECRGNACSDLHGPES